MKVLFLIDTLEVGGAEKSLLELAKRFKRTTPVICQIYQGDRLKRDFLDAGISVVSLGIPHGYHLYRATRVVKAVVKKEQPDLIHATLWKAGLVGRLAARSTGVPLVDSFVNDTYAPIRWQHSSRGARMKLKAIQAADRVTARWVTRFLAISEAISDTNASALRIPRNKVEAIYRGRDPKSFAPSSDADSQKLRESLSLSGADRVFLNVGRLLRRKGQDELVNAVHSLRNQFPQTRVLIAGEGNYKPQLQQRIDSLGLQANVILLGQRNDIPALLNMADYFVFPSHYEGLGGAIIEAMLAGKPIVATDIPAVRELISNKQHGLLVPPADSPALQTAMEWLLQHPEDAAEMGRKARERAVSNFAIDKIVEQTESFYERVLSLTTETGSHSSL